MNEMLRVESQNGALSLSGRLDVQNLATAKSHLTRRDADAVDLSGITHLDTAGALFLTQLAAQGANLRGLPERYRNLIELVGNLALTAPEYKKPRAVWVVTLIELGKKTVEAGHESRRMLSFIGQTTIVLLRALRKPSHLRLPSIGRHVREIGINAIPIIGLMAFMVSIVLAYQAIAQLRPYGGERFTVNLVTLSLLREMGVLLTAIMVAGRSGSAFTAEIGVMKAREEVDALQVTGIEPFEMLVIPRMIALILVLPLLTFLADVLGIAGGGVISLVLLDMTPAQYVSQVHEAAKLKDFLIGMIKAPVFAFFIGIIGCMHGLKVTSSAESVGQQTTASVVKSIFMVLVLDALFSIFFQQMGW